MRSIPSHLPHDFSHFSLFPYSFTLSSLLRQHAPTSIFPSVTDIQSAYQIFQRVLHIQTNLMFLDFITPVQGRIRTTMLPIIQFPLLSCHFLSLSLSLSLSLPPLSPYTLHTSVFSITVNRYKLRDRVSHSYETKGIYPIVKQAIPLQAWTGP